MTSRNLFACGNTATSTCRLWRFGLPLLIALIVTPIWAQVPLTGAPTSVALAEGATALSINPGGIGIRRYGTIFLSRSLGNDTTYTNVLLAGDGGGFGFRRVNFGDNGNMNRWLFGFGKESNAGVYSGMTVSYSDLDGGLDSTDGYWALSAGLTARPTPWLSLGVALNDISAPKEFGTYLNSGLALRLPGGRFKAFADATWQEDDSWSDPGGWKVGGEISAIPGISMGVQYDDNKNVLVSVGFGFPTGAMGGSIELDKDGNTGRSWVVAEGQRARNTRTIFNPSGQMARLRLQGSIQDQDPGFSLFGASARSLVNILSEIRNATDDPTIDGMYLELGPMAVGQGTAYEIRQALERFIGVGKSLVVYAEEMDTREYYIASVADSIVMPRLGTLNLIGFSATVPFLKGTLDKLGITPEFARIGRYKSAMETLTDTTISAADREQLESLLDDWYEQIVDRIAQSRGMIPDSLTKLIDISPMLANDAVSVGLLDKIGYRSEAKDAIKEMVGAGDSIIPQKFVDVRRRRYHDDRWGSRPQIALIFASGTIVLGESSSDFFSGSQGMGAETIGKAIRRARKNDSVKAIVFRVDSPGGSALASDLIWQELHQAVEDGKPVIVSMGDVAASGGYYVACAADTILAPPGAVVGSIGVFSGKMVMTDLYSKLGINTVILKRGRNADVYSSQQSLTDEQWEMLRKGVRDVYDVFVDRVAEGRNMNAADVDSLGRGRFYSGESALKYGLVDQLGGLYDALDIALEMAELEDASLLVLPETPSFWDAVWQADASALLPAIWRLRGQSPLLIDPLAGSLGQ